MKHITFKIHWLELTIAILLSVPAAYFVLAFVTDIRIESVREFVTKRGVEEGVKAGVAEYEKKYIEDESVAIRKRKARDAVIIKYIQGLEEMMSAK